MKAELEDAEYRWKVSQANEDVHRLLAGQKTIKMAKLKVARTRGTQDVLLFVTVLSVLELKRMEQSGEIAEGIEEKKLEQNLMPIRMTDWAKRCWEKECQIRRSTEEEEERLTRRKKIIPVKIDVDLEELEENRKVAKLGKTWVEMVIMPAKAGWREEAQDYFSWVRRH